MWDASVSPTDSSVPNILYRPDPSRPASHARSETVVHRLTAFSRTGLACIFPVPSLQMLRYSHSTQYTLRRPIYPHHPPSPTSLFHNFCPLTRHHLIDLRGATRAPHLQQHQALHYTRSTYLEAPLARSPLVVFSPLYHGHFKYL